VERANTLPTSPAPLRHRLGHSRAEYSIGATGHLTLPPIRFTVTDGKSTWSYQDYLTPDEAERLAASLLVFASEERARTEVAA
jgi:hypothetical protein